MIPKKQAVLHISVKQTGAEYIVDIILRFKSVLKIMVELLKIDPRSEWKNTRLLKGKHDSHREV